MLFRNVLMLALNEDTQFLEFKMAAGVHQDPELSGPLQSMEDPTDAEMVREDLGLMTSTGYQVYIPSILLTNLP